MTDPIAWHERPPEAVPDFDHDRAAAAVRELLIALGEDPEREGLRGTPHRVARAYAELTAGLRQSPSEVLTTNSSNSASGPFIARNSEPSSVPSAVFRTMLSRAIELVIPFPFHEPPFRAEDDASWSADFQRRMASWNPGAEVRGLQGADHMLMLSKPRELSELLVEVADRYCREAHTHT